MDVENRVTRFERFTRFARVCLAQFFIGLAMGFLAMSLLGGVWPAALGWTAAFFGAVFWRVELHFREMDARRRKEEDGEGLE